MVPLFRSFVSIPAGIERMPMATFLLGAAVQRRIGHGATASEAFDDAVAELRGHLPGAAPSVS